MIEMTITQIYIISGLLFFCWGSTAENVTHGTDDQKQLPACGIIHCEANASTYQFFSKFIKASDISKFNVTSVPSFMIYIYNQTDDMTCYIQFEELINYIGTSSILSLHFHGNLKHAVLLPPKEAAHNYKFDVIFLLIFASGPSLSGMSGLEEWVNVIKAQIMQFTIDFSTAHTVWKLITSPHDSFRIAGVSCERKTHPLNSVALEPDITNENDVVKSIDSVTILAIYAVTKINEDSYSFINKFTWLKVTYIIYQNIQFPASKFQETLRKMPKIDRIVWLSVSLLKDEELDLRKTTIRLLGFSGVSLGTVNENIISSKLEVVSLPNCNITSISNNAFEGKGLTGLLLSNNFIKSLENISFDSKNLTFIDLSHNAIKALSPNTLWPRSLRILKLGYNLIKHTERADFQRMPNLVTLDLSFNQIKVFSFKQLINSLDISNVDLSSNGLRKVAIHFDRHSRYVLNISNNNLETNSDFQNINANYAIKSTIDASNNSFTAFPLELVVFSKEQSNLDLSNNDIASSVWMDALNYFSFTWNMQISLRNNMIDKLPKNLSCSQKMRLRRIMTESIWDLTGNPLVCDCHAYFFYDFVKNKMKMSVVDCPAHLKDDSYDESSLWLDSFHTWQCSKPQRLSNRPFLHLSEKDFMCISLNLDGCPQSCLCYELSFNNLIHVNCSSVGLKELPTLLPLKTFSINVNNNSLHSEITLDNYMKYPYLEEVDLSKNKIEAISNKEIHSKQNTMILHLDNNQLSSLPTFFQNMSMKKLYLANNNFTCDCHNKWIHEWILINQDIIPDLHEVFCTVGKLRGVKMYKVSTDDMMCVISKATKIAIMMGVLAGLIPFIMVLFYCYRGEIKVYLYTRFNWHPFDKLDDQDVMDKLYDVFLSYSHLDEEWVSENLVPVFETPEHPYRMCLSMRDFLPCVSVSENICNGVKYSRRMVLLLTQNFLQSEWCTLEFKTAHHRVLKDKTNYLIIILADDINKNDLDEDLKLYLKTNTYIEWNSKWFQDRLLYSLPLTPLATLRGQEMPEGGFGVLFPSPDSVVDMRRDMLARQQAQDPEEIPLL